MMIIFGMPWIWQKIIAINLLQNILIGSFNVFNGAINLMINLRCKFHCKTPDYFLP